MEELEYNLGTEDGSMHEPEAIEHGLTGDLEQETEDFQEEGFEEEGFEDAPEEDFVQIHDVLKSFGIEDKINYEGQEYAYEDLSQEAKIDVLEQLLASNFNKEATYQAPQLSEEESAALSFLRENRMSFDEALEVYGRKVAEQMLSQQQAPVASISDLTNEEIFQYDYEQKLGVDWGSLSPDEMAEYEEDFLKALEAAKESKTFDKRMEALKQSYVSQEAAAYEEQQRVQREAEEREVFESYNRFVSSIEPISEVLGGFVQLEPDDKQFVINKIYSKDASGLSEFEKEMFSTPEKIFKTVYNAYRADETLKSMKRYYEEEIKIRVAEAKKEVLEGKSFPKKPISTSSTNKSNKQENNLLDLSEFHRRFGGI